MRTAMKHIKTIMNFGLSKTALLIEGKALIDPKNPSGRLISTRPVTGDEFDIENEI